MMIRFFASHKTAANLLMLVFLILGFFVVFQIRRETLPDFSEDQVQVTAVYPGATAEEVEEAICQRIEDAVDKVNNVKEVISVAKEGMGSVTVEMEPGADFQQFQNDIKTEVEAIDNFPDIVEKPVIKPLNRTDMVVSLAVTGPMSLADLKAYCEELKEKIQRKPSINQVEIAGFSQHQYKIEIPQETLMAYGLSIDDIARTIGEQNSNLPAGTLKTNERDFSIRFNDRRRTIPELKNMTVITGSSGAEIKLGDIAKITDDFELDEAKILFNGKRAGLLNITKPKSKDSLTIFDELNDFLQNERKIKPAGVKFYLTNNVSSIIRDRLNLLVKNGIQGIILVFLVLWLFFNLRFSFWVAMGLPISFMGAMFFIYLLNISINMISMVALLIAIGLLMDDAIVISENIATHIARGKKAVEAAIDGTKEVAVGVISSFATTVCVFGALFGIEGNVGKILRVIPIVLTLVLMVSLVEAFLILPQHLAHSFSHKQYIESKSWLRTKINFLIDWYRTNVVGRFATAAIPHRYMFIGCVICVFIISIGMVAGGLVKFRLFPDLDGDVIVARVLMAQGTPLKKTEAIADKLVNGLEKVNAFYKDKQPGKKDLIESTSVQFNVNTDADESGAHVVTVTADLLPGNERNTSINDILSSWRKNTGRIPNVISLTFKDFQPGPGGSPIDIRLKGENLKDLKRASLELQQKLKSYAGVHDITDNMRPGKMEIVLKLKPGAMKEGLTSNIIASQLRAAYHGSVADELQIDSESYEISVKLSDVRHDNIKRFDNFFIKLSDGRQIPLSAVTSIKSARGFAAISRKDGIRSVSIKAELDRKKANAQEVIADLRKNFLPGLCEKYPVWTDFEGESKESKETGTSMARSFVLGIIGIFILLSFQFKSYAEPLIVMMAIPMAIIGVIWGHFLMDKSLSMPSMMGFISLSGIVVNDSILLMEFIKIKVKEGNSVTEAAIEASKARFRPVMLTSLTTIAGLLPLLSERSMQAQMLIPLAISVVFGLAASTIMVLFVVPALYMIYQDWHPSTAEAD
jgi:multidrug efflux pump subunit AcrB